ncbi:hypothetical protein ACSNOI_46140, partial [Actinomadura kijaniata]|uniref:hypothetical protein n=1 Tax=Actinomadura kijaniata TaxID=46161 RepID=UPI003F1C43B2
MTDDKRFKQQVRALAAETGLSYTVARRRLLTHQQDPHAERPVERRGDHPGGWAMLLITGSQRPQRPARSARGEAGRLAAQVAPPLDRPGLTGWDSADEAAAALGAASWIGCPVPAPKVTLYGPPVRPEPTETSQSSQTRYLVRLEGIKAAAIDWDAVADAVRHRLIMIRHRWTRVAWQPVDVAEADRWVRAAVENETVVAGPLIAERDWFRRARVRLNRDVITSSPSDDGRVRRAGQVLTLVQHGRAGHAVDTHTWQTNLDADVCHYLRGDDLEVLEVLEETPPLHDAPELTAIHGRVSEWHQAHRAVVAIQAALATDPTQVDRLELVAAYSHRRGALWHLWDAVNRMADGRMQISPGDRRTLAATLAEALRVAAAETRRGTYDPLPDSQRPRLEHLSAGLVD